MQSLRLSNLETIVGKTIKFNAPSYLANSPYEGVFKVEKIDLSQERPIIGKCIEGDNLSYAFVDEFSNANGDDAIAYSDSDRYVSFEILRN